MSGCSDLRMDKFLPQCVGRLKVNWDLMFIEDSPESLRWSCDTRNDDFVTFSRLFLSVCSGSFRGFDKGSVWVATGFKLLLFLLLPLWLCGPVSARWFRIQWRPDCSVQEGQTASSDIFLCELDVIVHSINMFCEGFLFPCSDSEPSIFHLNQWWGAVPVKWIKALLLTSSK